MSCSYCGDNLNSMLHSPEGCILSLRARIERLEDRIPDPDFEVKPAQPEPKAGQVWRSRGFDVGDHTDILLVEGRDGWPWVGVHLDSGRCQDVRFPDDHLWEYVCDGAVPASEVRP